MVTQDSELAISANLISPCFLFQAKKDDKEATLKEKKRVEHHHKVAEEERRRMKEFDDYLVLAKYNP